MRTGAVLPARPPMAAGAAWSPNGLRDSKAGKAKQAPSPRRKWRRLKLANRSAAAFRSLLGLAFMLLRAARDWFGFMAGRDGFFAFGRHVRGAYSHLLERGRLDDAHEQSGEATVLFVEPLHNLVDGLHIIILHATSDGIG